MKNSNQKFNFHTHTYRCGHATLDYLEEEYIEDFIKMGFEKIAFTDHVPYEEPVENRPNIRMDYSQKNEYLNKIKELKEKYKDKIEIETGFEIEYSDIKKDYLLELRKEVDKLVLGQHFIFDNNNELFLMRKVNKCSDENAFCYVDHIKRALELKIPDIIAHPDVYLLARAGFNQTDEEVANRIGKLAEEFNIPLEINLNFIYCRTYYEGKQLNNDPFEEQVKKLDDVIYPNRKFWEIISNYNVKVVYGLDVHYRYQIERFNELVELAHIIIGKETIDKLNFVEKL